VRNVVKDLTTEISEKVLLTVAGARACMRSFDLLYGTMVPDGRASSGGYICGEQVMVDPCVPPYTADKLLTPVDCWADRCLGSHLRRWSELPRRTGNRQKTG